MNKFQTKYKIRDYTEETVCEYCGMPLHVGDSAVQVNNDQVFCSFQCSDLRAQAGEIQLVIANASKPVTVESLRGGYYDDADSWPEA